MNIRNPGGSILPLPQKKISASPTPRNSIFPPPAGGPTVSTFPLRFDGPIRLVPSLICSGPTEPVAADTGVTDLSIVSKPVTLSGITEPQFARLKSVTQ